MKSDSTRIPFKYKTLGITGYLDLPEPLSVLASTGDEGTVIAEAVLLSITKLPSQPELIIPIWEYPYQLNIKITRDWLSKARTRVLISVRAAITVEVQYKPY